MSKPVLLYFEYVGAWYSEHLLMKLVITKSNAQKTMVSYSWCTFDGAIFSIAQGLCVSLIDNSFIYKPKHWNLISYPNIID